MDDPDLPPAKLEHALSGLARLNSISGAFNRTFSVILAEANLAKRPLRVLDIACARGDFTIAAALAASRANLAVHFTGCDFNPQSIALAQTRARPAQAPCSFLTLDVLKNALPEGFDIILASLFFHHLTNTDAVALLRKMAGAARLVVVNDLIRSRPNLFAVSLASRLLTRSPVVHTDAALSVRAAFTKQEMLELSHHAGLRDATIQSGGISRMMLVWRKAS